MGKPRQLGKTLGLLMLSSMLAVNAAPLTNPQPLRLITEHSPPGEYLDASGKVAGPTVELLKVIAQRLNQPISMDLLPWARALEIARNEPNIGLFETIRNPEREHWFQWVGPLKIYQTSLYARLRDDHQSIRAADLPGRWIACANRGSVYAEKIQARGFTQQHNLVLTVNEDNCVKLMLQGKVDLAPFNEYSLQRLLDALDDQSHVDAVVPLVEVELYLAFSLDVPLAQVQAWQDALAQSYHDGTMRRMYQGTYSEAQISQLENSVTKQAQ